MAIEFLLCLAFTLSSNAMTCFLKSNEVSYRPSLLLLLSKATITRSDLSPNSFVLMLRYCENLKVIRYE